MALWLVTLGLSYGTIRSMPLVQLHFQSISLPFCLIWSMPYCKVSILCSSHSMLVISLHSKTDYHINLLCWHICNVNLHDWHGNLLYFTNEIQIVNWVKMILVILAIHIVVNIWCYCWYFFCLIIAWWCLYVTPHTWN